MSIATDYVLSRPLDVVHLIFDRDSWLADVSSANNLILEAVITLKPVE